MRKSILIRKNPTPNYDKNVIKRIKILSLSWITTFGKKQHGQGKQKSETNDETTALTADGFDREMHICTWLCDVNRETASYFRFQSHHVAVFGLCTCAIPSTCTMRWKRQHTPLYRVVFSFNAIDAGDNDERRFISGGR